MVLPNGDDIGQLELLQGSQKRATLAIKSVCQDQLDLEALGDQTTHEVDGDGGLSLVDITGFETALRLEDLEQEREGDVVENAIGADRDDAVVDRAEVADVLTGGIVGGLTLLEVARFIDDEDERAVAKGLFRQREALGS